MSTTLIEELEQAAKRSDWLAFQCTPQAVGEARSKELRGIHEAEARCLRQRAAWVRELMAGPRGQLSIAQQLTGPVPCTQCSGSGYVRHVGYGNDEVVEDCPACTGPIPAAETAPTERKEP